VQVVYQGRSLWWIEEAGRTFRTRHRSSACDRGQKEAQHSTERILASPAQITNWLPSEKECVRQQLVAVNLLSSPRQGLFFFNIHMCIQCLHHFSPLPPAPSFTPPNPSIPGRNYFALISSFVEDSTSNNRKDQGFLLVEIRIAIQGVDWHCFPVHVCYLLS
jgi:hypothetical protein